MASTTLKKALSFTKINTPIFAKRNNLYSRINPFGPRHMKNIILLSPMASTTLKKALNFTQINTPIFARTYCTAKRDNLYSRIDPRADPNLSVVPVLEQWVQEGKEVKELELKRIVDDLRSSGRDQDVLQVLEWMSSKGLPFSVCEPLEKLKLIYRVQGVEAAESYFNNLNDKDEIEEVYHWLFYCYGKEGLVDKSIAHMEKMKEMGFLSHASSYNDLMLVYALYDKIEKVPAVLSDMKANGVPPNNLSYRICMQAYGARSDFSSIELILEEVENLNIKPDVTMDFLIYATAANIYVKAGLKEKALIHLGTSEEKVSVKDAIGYNEGIRAASPEYHDALAFNQLISYHTTLGNKDEMMRLWGLRKSNSETKNLDRDYITMMRCLVMIGELKEAEKLFKEWERPVCEYDHSVLSSDQNLRHIFHN